MQQRARQHTVTYAIGWLSINFSKKTQQDVIFRSFQLNFVHIAAKYIFHFIGLGIGKRSIIPELLYTRFLDKICFQR